MKLKEKLLINKSKIKIFLRKFITNKLLSKSQLKKGEYLLNVLKKYTKHIISLKLYIGWEVEFEEGFVPPGWQGGSSMWTKPQRQYLENMENRLNDKIDTVEQRLDAKIDVVEQRLDAKIDAVEERLNAKIDRLADLLIELTKEVRELKEIVLKHHK